MAFLLAVTCGISADRGRPPEPAPAASASPAPTSRPTVAIVLAGKCSEQRTTNDVVRRYFELSTSDDPAAVADCFVARWRGQPNFEDGARLWSRAGPVLRLEIKLIDRVRGCDRFDVQGELANRQSLGQSDQLFFVVGPDGNGLRIHETATGLASAERSQTTCPGA